MDLCNRCESEFNRQDISQYGQVAYPGLCKNCIFFIIDEIASSHIPIPEEQEWQHELDSGPSLRFGNRKWK